MAFIKSLNALLILANLLLIILVIIKLVTAKDVAPVFPNPIEPITVQTKEDRVVIASYESPAFDLPTEPERTLIPLGDFEVTAYTAGFESTGKRVGDPGYGITASGVEVEEGVTIASDWSVLPKGSRVLIEGVGERLVQDKGSAIKGMKLDVYIPELDDALEFGRQTLRVYLIEGG